MCLQVDMLDMIDSLIGIIPLYIFSIAVMGSTYLDLDMRLVKSNIYSKSS